MAFSVPLTMLFGSMAAYVLARYEFPGNRFIYFLFVGGAMFPVYLALVPLFFMVRNLGMLNTYQGLILVYVAYSLPFTVFFMHAFFRTLPTAIHEAAVIDGASHSRVFFQVMLPMAKPGLLSVGIFNVLGQWNQYILPVTLMQPQSSTDPDRSMLAQGLVNLALTQGYAGDKPALFAGMAIAMLPVLAVYLSFQRQVQSGSHGGHPQVVTPSTFYRKRTLPAAPRYSGAAVLFLADSDNGVALPLDGINPNAQLRVHML